MPERDYAKISPTAISVALARAAFTEMPYTKEIFRHIRPIADLPFYAKFPGWFVDLARHLPRPVKLVAGLEIRYRSTNAVLDALGEPWSIVEIAAGVSPRSLELAGRHAYYVETDLPGMIELKREVLTGVASECGIDASKDHAFIELNALDPAGWETLGKTQFSGRDSKIAVINEGLLGYLSREEKTRLRDNIRTFFESHAAEGAWISPDFSNLVGRYSTWISRRGERLAKRRVGRLFDRFDTREEVLSFLERGGFRIQIPPSNALVEQLTCTKVMHARCELIQPLLAKHQAWVAWPY